MMSNTPKYFILENDVAVVTGGLGNLGPYWIKALIEAGAKVTSIDLPHMKVPKILSPYLGKKFLSFEADITSLVSLRKARNEINQKMGVVTILVNNAGIDAPPIKKQNQDSQLYTKMWEVNVQGMANCIEEFYPSMKNKKKGSIINIASLYAERSPNEELYSHLNFDKPWTYGATKSAVLQLTRHFATRLAKYNIRVNALSPGGVLGNQDKEFVNKYSEKVPLGRMANKETDLGGPLIFLASSASSYVTGINLQVNGGYTAW